jgi:uncharacterized protein (DUF427 family)
MKATLNGVVVAEAADDDIIHIEGNAYFPPDSVNAELLEKSPTPYRCPWKGDCQYFNVRSGDEVLEDRAWSYPDPIPSSFDVVGKDYTDYVAFWKEVEVS